MSRGTSLRGPVREGAVHLTSATESAPQFRAVSPTQTQMTPEGRDGRKQRRLGLMPAQAGYNFPMIVREAPAEKMTAKELGQLRAELRKADSATKRIEAELTDAVVNHGNHSDQARAKQTAWDSSVARANIFRRRVADAEQGQNGRPKSVVQATVHEPQTVQDAVANADFPPRLICFHEDCKGREWGTESAMRMAHRPHAEMVQKREAHVYVYLSDAPADPADPEGPRIGYIAPIGRDGTTVQTTAAPAEEYSGVEERMAAQDARIAELTAALENLTKKPAKQG